MPVKSATTVLRQMRVIPRAYAVKVPRPEGRPREGEGLPFNMVKSNELFSAGPCLFGTLPALSYLLVGLKVWAGRLCSYTLITRTGAAS